VAGFVPECHSTIKTNTDDPKLAGLAPERWQGLGRITQAIFFLILF
jgi:hypothetical protein